MTSRNQWKTDILHGGSFRLDGGSMFGIIPKGIWSSWTGVDERNRIDLNCNLVLLRDGEHTALVEVGYGDKFPAKERDIFSMSDRTAVDALGEAGVEPEDVTHVLLTHLHFDHAGGLTRLGADGETINPTFPNATIIIQKQEWEDANTNRSTMSRTYLKSHLEPIADQVKLVEGESEPLPGLVVSPMPGHTWGQQSISWEDTDRSYAYPGDVCPTIAHAHPSASMGYDVEPWTNMNSKLALLQACARSGRSIILDHEPGSPLVDVRESTDHAGRFDLIPLDAGT